jgi:hypothetical protein
MANPTYQSGFYAPGRGTAKYPELWDGCVGAWNPGLGNTGLVLRDWSGNQNNGTLTNGPTWGVSDGRQALDFEWKRAACLPLVSIRRLRVRMVDLPFQMGHGSRLISSNAGNMDARACHIERGHAVAVC